MTTETSELLKAGIEQHRLGRLDLAEGAYRQILAQDAQHADALHLLGVVLHQRGHHTQGAQSIVRAINLSPNIAAYHSNLGEVFRAMKDFKHAVLAFETAIKLDPRYVQAINNLGLARDQAGDAEGAIESFRRAIELDPTYAVAHNNLGNTLIRLKRKKEAADAFRKAVELNPQSVEALSNLGQVLLETESAEEALPLLERAVELRPNFAEAHNNLGNVLRELERIDEAKEKYKRSLQLNPNYAMTFNNMGQALQEEGKLGEAERWYRKALSMEGGSAKITANFASLLAERDQFEPAIRQFRKSLELDPDSIEGLMGLGHAFEQLERYDEAIASYRRVQEIDPEHAGVHIAIAHILTERGMIDEAVASQREALKLRPMHPGALAGLATNLRGKLPAEDLDALESLLKKPSLREGQRASVLHGLAHVYDGQGRYDAAAEATREANALAYKRREKRGEAYDPADYEKHIDELIAVFTPEFFARAAEYRKTPEFEAAWAKLETDVPVFVVGLPRSSTTLTEQILASHPRVCGAGELRVVRECFDLLPEAMGAFKLGENQQKIRPRPIECLPYIHGAAMLRLINYHLTELRKIDPGAARIVDKMPDNYSSLGLIATLYPNARIIHCNRDLRDVAVSCWVTNFKAIRWANKPEHIASRFKQYQRIMAHWRAVLPVPILEVDYQQTVNDLPAVARKMIDYIGLEWDDACLEPHKTQRSVRTASVTQVRKPVYSTSLERWRKYEPYLGDLFRELVPERTE